MSMASWFSFRLVTVLPERSHSFSRAWKRYVISLLLFFSTICFTVLFLTFLWFFVKSSRMNPTWLRILISRSKASRCSYANQMIFCASTISLGWLLQQKCPIKTSSKTENLIRHLFYCRWLLINFLDTIILSKMWRDVEFQCGWNLGNWTIFETLHLQLSFN